MKLWQIGGLLIFLAASSTVFAQLGTNALMVQQSPVDGGVVTPGVGVYDMENDSRVNLTAVPNPGYQFVYWLGDVSDSTSNSTVAYLNSPKIVIAVFERVGYEYLPLSEAIRNTPAGRLYSSPGYYPRSEYTGGGSDDPEDPPEYPEVPEPAAILTLTAGAMLLKLMKKKKKTS